MTVFYKDFFIFLKIAITFSFLYIWLPSRIIHFDDAGKSMGDRIFIPMIHSMFVINVLVHFLVFIHLYEPISLIFLIVVSMIIVMKITKKGVYSKKITKKSLIVSLLNASEKNIGCYIHLLEKVIKNKIDFMQLQLRNVFKHIVSVPFDGVILLIPFTYAAYDRFSHAFSRYAYIYSDPYVHLKWIKYLGKNEIYVDGVYPYGYEVVISAISELFFIDPSIILRFIGALAGIIIVFSIYFFLKKYTTNSFIVFIALTPLIRKFPISVNL